MKLQCCKGFYDIEYDMKLYNVDDRLDRPYKRAIQLLGDNPNNEKYCFILEIKKEEKVE